MPSSAITPERRQRAVRRIATIGSMMANAPRMLPTSLIPTGSKKTGTVIVANASRSTLVVLLLRAGFLCMRRNAESLAPGGKARFEASHKIASGQKKQMGTSSSCTKVSIGTSFDITDVAIAIPRGKRKKPMEIRSTIKIRNATCLDRGHD